MMQNTRKLYWGAQIIGWSSYATLIFLATYDAQPEKVDSKLIVNLLALVAAHILFTHLLRYIYIKMNWLQLKLFPLIPRVLVLSVVSAVFIELFLQAFTHYFDQEKELVTPLAFMVNVFVVSVFIVFWNAIYFTYHFFQQSRKKELENVTLEASRNEIELKNLRSQLNPHFLFNSLNSIRALIDIDPSKAKNSVTTLSSLLRTSLQMGKKNLVSVEEELLMVSNYLELEKVRFEERLSVFWDIDDRLNDFQIPPFCMQMLVENAIKHGISNMIEGGEIKILTKKEKDHILLQVSNSGELGSSTDTGIGVENTRRRLAIQFQGKAEFILAQKDSNVVATLTFEHEDI